MAESVPVAVSWRKRILGIVVALLAILGAGKALLDEDPATSPDVQGVLKAVTAPTESGQ